MMYTFIVLKRSACISPHWKWPVSCETVPACDVIARNMTALIRCYIKGPCIHNITRVTRMAPEGSKQRETLPETYWDTVLVDVCRRSPGRWSETSFITSLVSSEAWGCLAWQKRTVTTRIGRFHTETKLKSDRQTTRNICDKKIKKKGFMTADEIHARASRDQVKKVNSWKEKETQRHARTSTLWGHCKTILVSACVLFSQNSYFQGFFLLIRCRWRSKNWFDKQTVTMPRNKVSHYKQQGNTENNLKKEGRTLVYEWPSFLGIICHIKNVFPVFKKLSCQTEVIEKPLVLYHIVLQNKRIIRMRNWGIPCREVGGYQTETPRSFQRKHV